MIQFSHSLKAQSAIEYLMTYGWMLLVVAIVGAAIFAVAQGDTPNTVSGFTGANVIVEDFGITTDDELELVLRNAGGQSTTVNSVNVTDGGQYTAWTGSLILGVADTSTVTLANVSQSDGAETLNVDLNYDHGALTDLQISGTISGGLQLTEEASLVDENGEENGNGEQTQFYTDFEDDEPGTFPSYLERQIDEGSEQFEVVSSNPIDGTQALKWEGEWDQESVHFSDSGIVEAQEVFVEMYAVEEETVNEVHPVVRAEGVAEDWENRFYSAGIDDEGDLEIWSRSDGVSSLVVSTSVSVDLTDSFYHRFRAEGENLGVKVWQGDVADEPEDWDIETPDDSYEEGFAGISGHSPDDFYILKLAVGTEGAEAPTEPVG